MRGLCSFMVFSLVFVLSASPAFADPLPVTTGLQLWLDASDPATMFQDSGGTNPVTADGQTVLAWRDKSANSYLAARSSGGPTYTAAAIGGAPALAFATDTNPLAISGGIGAIGAGADRTVFLVFDYDPNVRRPSEQDMQIFGTSNGRMLDVGVWPSSHGPERLRIRSDSVNTHSPSGTVPTGENQLTILGTSTGLQAWRQGENILDSPDPGFAWTLGDTLGIGGANHDPRAFVGDLAEVIVYSSALSFADRVAVEHYLAEKYSLKWVPEPSAVVLLLIGAATTLLWRRRRT